MCKWAYWSGFEIFPINFPLTCFAIPETRIEIIASQFNVYASLDKIRIQEASSISDSSHSILRRASFKFHTKLSDVIALGSVTDKGFDFFLHLFQYLLSRRRANGRQNIL